MVAGNKSIVDRCQPVLEAVGKHITYVGAEVGIGSAPKRGMPSWGQASQIRGYCKSLS
jgi:hypothetical protein